MRRGISLQMVGKLTNGGWEGSLQRRCKTKLHCIGHFSSVWGNSSVLIVALIFSTSFFITHSYSLSFPLTISPTVGWLLRAVTRVRCTNTVRANTFFAAASLPTSSTANTCMQMNYCWTNHNGTPHICLFRLHYRPCYIVHKSSGRGCWLCQWRLAPAASHCSPTSSYR